MNNSIFNLIIAKTYVPTANFIHHGERKFAKCASFHFTDCITRDEMKSIYYDLRFFRILNMYLVFANKIASPTEYSKKDKKY